MAAYKDLVGQKITKVTSNPGEPKTGQMWYNSTDGKLRGLGILEAWASTSPLIQSRDSAGAAGTQTAAMVFGGRNEVDGGPTGGPNAQYNLNEEYNGTGYSTGGALVQGRQGLSGAGTQTAGLGVGGYHPPSPGPKSLVEEYDGSSWSEVTNQPTATFGQGSAGTQTAAVVFGGRGGPGSTWTNATYEYDGSSWTTGGSMGTARVLKGAATGTQTAALAVGGDLTPPGGATDKVEEYDGTSFSEVNAAPANIQVNMVSGIQTSALSFGGNISPYTTQTFKYDGTNFTASAAMGSSASGQNTLKTATDNLTGLSMGGYGTSSYIATSQEFTTSTNTITAAAWASGGALNTAGRAGAAGSGTQTAAIIAGGGLGTVINNAESYDGNSWTNLPTIGTARGYMAGATNAPYTATLVFGGATGPGGPYVNNSEEYSGSSWAEGNNLNTARGYLAGFGIQTAAVAAGGTAPNPSPPSRQNAAEEYDGTNWTSVTNIPAAANSWGGCGTQTAGLVIGDVPMKGLLYDGTNWTTIPTLNTPGNYNKVFGTYSSAMTAGRNPTPAAGTAVEEWNGTTWFTQASLATGRFNGLGAGTTTAGLVAGAPTATEEFTGETSAANIADFTTS